MNTLQKFIAGFLLILILILTNMFANLFSWKLDFTDSKLFTLSKGSRLLIEKLEEPVDFDFYFSRSVQGLPISFKNYGTRVEEMLRQFESAANGMIRLNIINPKPDTEEEEAATQAGVNGSLLSNGQQLFFGLAMTQADNQEAISVFDYRKEEFLEYDIAKALYTVQQWDKPTIGLISGLPVVGTPQYFPGQQPQSADWVFVEQLRQTFEITQINSAGDWPAVIDVLMVVHPQNLDDELLFEIDQYLLEGKPAFIAVDPSSYFMKAQQNPQNMMMMMGQPPQGVSSNLRQLFTAYGIDFNDMELLVDSEYAALVSSQSGRIQMPTWLNLGAESLNTNEFILSQLDSLLMVEPGSFGKTEESNLEIIPLIQSSPRAGKLFAMLANQISPAQMASQINASGDPLTIAGFVRGTLNTAFPDGKPQPPSEEGDEEVTPPAPPLTDASYLSESAAPSNLFLIADSDWLQDQFSVQRLNFLGVTAFQPLNDNLNLLRNTIEFMSGSQDLISIRPRGNSIRPFKVVDEIERQAQVEYQQKLDELNREVQEFEESIRQLLSQQGEGNSLIITPELQAKIDELNKNASAKRGQRREVRKKLREQVESLGFSLALANLTVIPGLVFLSGILFFIRRHHRK
ncbi:MAG: Gldg family protein [Verrucomicrobia bacterium]|nr:Gldg family protein [Verrucomicrobiota bacterium]